MFTLPSSKIHPVFPQHIVRYCTISSVPPDYTVPATIIPPPSPHHHTPTPLLPRLQYYLTIFSLLPYSILLAIFHLPFLHLRRVIALHSLYQFITCPCHKATAFLPSHYIPWYNAAPSLPPYYNFPFTMIHLIATRNPHCHHSISLYHIRSSSCHRGTHSLQPHYTVTVLHLRCPHGTCLPVTTLHPSCPHIKPSITTVSFLPL